MTPYERNRIILEQKFDMLEKRIGELMAEVESLKRSKKNGNERKNVGAEK